MQLLAKITRVTVQLSPVCKRLIITATAAAVVVVVIGSVVVETLCQPATTPSLPLPTIPHWPCDCY